MFLNSLARKESNRIPILIECFFTGRQRKELKHQQLITEVIQQLAARFSPDVNLLKKKIESLIEREYLERVGDIDRPAYRYMA